MSAINMAMEEVDKRKLEESFNRYVENVELVERFNETQEALSRCRELLRSEKDLNNRLSKRQFGSITRVEVIDPAIGRAYVNHNVKSTELSIQDNGRTLKIFLT